MNTRFAYGTKDHLDYQPFNQNYQLFIGRTIYKSRTYELIYFVRCSYQQWMSYQRDRLYDL